MLNDFHRELIEKLKAIQDEKVKTEQTLRERRERIRDLSRAADGIMTLLRLEGVDPEHTEEHDNINNGNGSEPTLYNALFELLSDHREHSAEELVEGATGLGVDFEEKDPFKTVNFTLLGISRGGKVERTGRNKWRLSPTE